MSVSNDNNFKPIVGGAVSASAEVSTEKSATTTRPATVDTTSTDDTQDPSQIPNVNQPFVNPSKKPKIALSGSKLTDTGLAMKALNPEAKAEETHEGNLFFNVSHDQVLLQMALQEFVKMNQDVRTANAVLAVKDRNQQIEAREELQANVLERGETLKDQYNQQGNWEIAGGWVNATVGVVGIFGAKALASKKVSDANAAAIRGNPDPNNPGGFLGGNALTADVKVKMMSEYEASFSTVSQQLGSAISGSFSAKDKWIQAESSASIALIDEQKVLLEDRQQAIKAAKDLAEQAVNSSSIDEFRRANERAQESLAVKPFQG